MASEASARPAGRRDDRPIVRAGRPPSPGHRLRSTLARAVAAALLAIAALLPATATAAQGLVVTTPYPAVAVGPGSDVSFDLSVDSAGGGRVNLSLQGVPQGWTGTLRGGGFVVDGVETTGSEPAKVTLDLTIPADASGTHQIVVRATSGGQTTDLPLSLRIAEQAAGAVKLTTDFPSLRGPSDATFPFKLTLSNDTPRQLNFVVEAQAPQGWTATTKVTGQEQAASALVDAGGSAGIDVSVKPPADAAAGSVTIPVTATSGSEKVTTELTVEITGSYSMTVGTPDQRLNTSGSAGSQIRQTIDIHNTGTSPLEGVVLSATNPSGWSVRFEPATVPTIPAGDQQPAQVTAIITPSGDAIAGDYSVKVTASSDTAGSSDLDLRVTVETSLVWGLVGVAIIIAVLGGLWWVFQRYGRR